MRTRSEVETLISTRRCKLGITLEDFAKASVGSLKTWYARINAPETFRIGEIWNIADVLSMDEEQTRKLFDDLRKETR